MRRVAAILSILIAGSVPTSRAVEFAGGTGEPNDPYQIATAEHLIAIGSDPSLLDKHFILVSDVDLDPNLPGGRAFLRAVIAPDTINSDRFRSLPFTGSFDGNGHRIVNVVFRGSNHFTGLFGEIGEGGIVHDLRVESVRFEDATGLNRGALASSNKGTILRCRTTGFLVGGGKIGGLIGINNGEISSCRSDCFVHGTTRHGLIGDTALGGLIGYNESGMVVDCYATGSISGIGGYAGGLVGDNGEGIFSRCYARGVVAGAVGEIGGLSGATSKIWFPPSPGSIRHCFWDIDTTGQVLSSGGFGRTTAQMKHAATYIGWGPEWTIEEGKDYPSLAWEQASGVSLQNRPPRIYDGKGDADEPFILRDTNDLLCLMARSEDWSCAFDIANDIDMSGVPFLPLADFSGLLDGKGHKISNLAIHENSILLGLIGSLDGGVVRNLCLSDVDIQGAGLVGALAGLNFAGGIMNCAMTGRIIATTVEHNGYEYYGNVGGLVGNNYRGYISECSAMPAATCKNRSQIGGLVAFNHGHVTCSRAMADIFIDEMVQYAGGFAAWNGGSITNCLSGGSIARRPGAVDGEWCNYTRYLSGFVASSWGPIVHCYAFTRVSPGDPNCMEVAGFLPELLEGGSASDCFWDTEASGLLTSDAGTGMTTVRMRQQASFVGWNFETVWTICEGRDYPRLRWEGVACDVEP